MGAVGAKGRPPREGMERTIRESAPCAAGDGDQRAFVGVAMGSGHTADGPLGLLISLALEGSHGPHRTRTGGVAPTGRSTFGTGDMLATVPVISSHLGGGALACYSRCGLISRFTDYSHSGLKMPALKVAIVKAELFGTSDLAAGHVKRSGDAIAVLVGGSGDGTLRITLLLSCTSW